jgi:hypothetical protein
MTFLRFFHECFPFWRRNLRGRGWKREGEGEGEGGMFTTLVTRAPSVPYLYEASCRGLTTKKAFSTFKKRPQNVRPFKNYIFSNSYIVGLLSKEEITSIF